MALYGIMDKFIIYFLSDNDNIVIQDNILGLRGSVC